MAKPNASGAAAESGGAATNDAGNHHPQQHQQLTESFVRAFDKQRSTLAGFARCSNLEELHVVRDGFYLGMAKDLCPDEYKRVLVMVLKRKFGSSNGNGNGDETNSHNDNGCYDTGIVPGENQGMLSMSFEEMVLAARVCDNDNEIDTHTDNDNHNHNKSNNTNTNTNTNENDETKDTAAAATTTTTTTHNAIGGDDDATKTTTRYWKDLLEALFRIAETVGSELESSVWKTLEDGRMQWLRAVSAAHPIKTILQKALALESKSKSETNDANTSDAMMVWIYTICVHLTTAAEEQEDDDDTDTTTTTTQLKRAVDDWMVAVDMTDRFQPLKNYQAELWDPRRDEWRPLDIGAQEAAERGGADLLEAWNAKGLNEVN
mmetsp:Transcript_25115/g.53393  ORF Transcript_25115/g.53393 Transcript_25115/m.53393 type:complete len:376 (-) Transcript_25115:168-1295(-)